MRTSDIEVPEQPTVRITKQAWLALKKASNEYGETMSDLATAAVCTSLVDFVVREEPHEDQLDLFEGLIDQ